MDEFNVALQSHMRCRPRDAKWLTMKFEPMDNRAELVR
jgi:hypothetical protein